MSRPLKLLLISFVVGLALFLGTTDGFIAHADFSFYIDPVNFLNRHIFLWSELKGAVNIDSNIRVLQRSPFILLYFLVGSNTALSYIFIVLNSLFVYLSGWIFCNKFLDLPRKKSYYIALFFLFNPVFLGNFSKLGLVFGVALLPLLLLSVRKFFQTKKIGYLLIALLLQNASFIHPFIFVINSIIGLAYFAYHWLRSASKTKLIGQSILVTGLGVLLNLYFIIPTLILNLSDKESLSNSIGTSGQGLFIHNLAITDSIIEAGSLAKSVFVEYTFYPEGTEALYYIVYIGIYALILTAFLLLSKHFNRQDKKWFLAATLFFILTIYLTRGSDIDWVNSIYSSLQNLPAGWFFRSPLKVQLYQPILLLTIFALLFKNIPQGAKASKWVFHSLFIIILSTNFFLFKDIYRSLLIPDKFNPVFSQIDFTGQEVLFEKNKACRKQINEYRELFYSLQHQITNQARVYNVLTEESLMSNDILQSNYDYIINCDQGGVYTKKDFEPVFASTEPNITVLQNMDSKPEIYLSNQILQTEQILTTDKLQAVLGDRVIAQGLGENYIDIFANDLRNNVTTIESSKNVEVTYTKSNETITIYAGHLVELWRNNELVYDDEPVELYSGELSENFVTINGKDRPIFTGEYSLGIFPPTQIELSIPTTSGDQTITQDISQHAYQNTSGGFVEFRNIPVKSDIIENGDFVSGNWQKRVGDCFNTSDEPNIGMEYLEDDERLSDGFGVELYAQKHVACISKVIEVEPGYELDLSFDVIGSDNDAFEYILEYNNQDKTEVKIRHEVTGLEIITGTHIVPLDANKARLFLRVPQTDLTKTNRVIIDNVNGTLTPITAGTYISDTSEILTQDATIAYSKINQTKYISEITGGGKVGLITKQIYNPFWEVLVNGESIGSQFKANYLYNGWVIDIDTLCENKCPVNDNGDYTIELDIEFSPQRSYQIALSISFATLLLLVGYIVYDLKYRS